jgi:replicative DNA helicase
MNIEDAERSVVGACIYVPTVVRDVTSVVAPADFTDTRLGETFGLILGMVTAGGPDTVTPLTIAAEIERRRAAARTENGRLRARWLTATDVAVLATSVVPGNVLAHARLVREAAVARALAAFGRRVTLAAESGADPAPLAAGVAEEARAIRDGWRPAGLPARPLGDVLDDDEDDTYDWLIPGLLESRDRLILTGGEGAGKSTLTSQIVVCLAAGVHPFTGRQAEPGRVLVVDCENSERQWRRRVRGVVAAADRLGSASARENVTLACVSRMDITTPGALGAVHSLIDEHHPALISIGPLYRLVPRAITNDDDAAPVLAALDTLRDRGAALIMEAHAGHAIGRGGERDHRPRGSAALMGWPEFGLGLSQSHESGEEAIYNLVRWRGDRDERDWPPRLRRGGTLPWSDDRTEPGLIRRDYGLRMVD